MIRGAETDAELVRAALALHPVVAGVVVVADPLQVGGLLAYVVPTMRQQQPEPLADALAAERAAEWELLFDRSHGEPTTGDPTFDTAGWVSSYTGRPIPAPEMAAWTGNTVAAILDLEPRRVLELGCGTGLLLWRLAPHCETYVGTDFSGAALTGLASHLAEAGLAHVRLLHTDATDFGAARDGGLDTVIVNSVVETFPRLDYLELVLHRAVEAVRPGGKVFVGNVRSLPLLETFYGSVELARASPGTSTAELRERVWRRANQEIELVVDPAFFAAWADREPDVAGVEVRLQRGGQANELSRFRYDVILHIGPGSEPIQVDEWLDWGAGGLSVPELSEVLRVRGPTALGLAGIPNARVATDAMALELMAAADPPATAGGIAAAIASARAGVDPEDVWGVGDELGYTVQCSWASGAPAGAFDAVFLPAEQSRGGPVAFPRRRVPEPAPRWANDPLAGRAAMRRSADVIGELRRHLAARLPASVAQPVIVTLPAFPLDTRGEIDHAALPSPPDRRSLHAAVRATPTEDIVATIWANVLGVDQVELGDEFFALGGDSLLGAQVISRLREAFGVDVPLRVLFANVTVRAMAGAVSEMMAERPVGPPPPLSSIDRSGDDLAPSFAQERLWFLDQLVPDNPFYNVPAVFRLTGPVDVVALRRALDEIVARHETLRTTFPGVGGRPRQRIAATGVIDLPLVDLGDLGPEDAEARARLLVGKAAAQPFDLARGPLVRGMLLRLGPGHHVLAVTMHHIVSDGWSIGVLLRELRALYASFSCGLGSPLAPLRVQYADFAAWHREWLDGEVGQTQLNYWKEKLGGAPPALELPTDRPRPPIPSYRGATHLFEIAPDVGLALLRLGRTRGTTPFMVLLAAFKILLGRDARSDDVVVGTPVAGRMRPELEDLIALFVNTVALRTDLSEATTFDDVLMAVRETTLEACDHQDLPFERVVMELQPDRDLSRNPLVQVMFQVVPLPPAAMPLGETVVLDDVGGLTGAEYGGPSGSWPVAPLDLDLSMAPTPDGGFTGAFVYSTDLFDPATVGWLATRFTHLLGSIAVDAQLALAELHLPAEEHLRPVAPTSPAAPVTPVTPAKPAPPDEATLADLVEATARRYPASTAAEAGAYSMSYAELDRRANRLAHHLQRLGVRPDSRVGICIERSLDLAVGLLAIVKAGGACVPLDPLYPADRLAFMVRDSQAQLVLTRSALAGRLPAGSGAVVRLDADAGDWADQPAAAPSREVQPRHLAYVIYTSGSTGGPKGVMLTHRGLVNHHRAVVGLYGLRPTDRVLQFCSISFDASVEEIFASWLAGAAVVFRPDDLPILGRAWLEWLGRARITVLDLPTAYWHEWTRDLDAIDGSVPGAVRIVVVGGDKALGATYQSWTARVGPGTRWINTYGPTEASIVASTYECPPGAELEDGRDPPIGRPLPNTFMRVVDQGNESVPDGVTGELVIGGAGVARGYLDRPELTAQRFVVDPGSEGPDARLYRTGDMVRVLPGGDFEFVGRVDDQVKIRGFRVECAEVEAALARHPQLFGAVVVAREDRPGDRRLTAYVVPAPRADPPSVTELRRFLAEVLPAYMVPTAYVTLAAVPLTPNGKVDRAALPAPDPVRARSADRIVVRPRTPAEQAIAAIWARVLAVSDISVHDDFFELGGHSLLATQVIAHIRETFGTETPLRAMFDAPTVAGLAAVVEAENARPVTAPRLAARPREPGARFPLSLAQEQMWNLEAQAEPPGLFNVTALRRFERPVDETALRRALDTIVDRHETLRTSFAIEAGRPWQIVAPAASLELTTVDLTALAVAERDAARERCIAEHDARPFAPDASPLVRAQLLHVDDTSSELVVTFDHLVCDGTSAYIFLTELKAAYAAATTGGALELTPLEIQFSDFAVWQRAVVTEEVLARQLRWWTERLTGMPPGPVVPFDHMPATPTRRIASREIAVPAGVRKLLDQLARRSASTMFVVAAAAVDAVFSRHGGTTDVMMSTTLSGRSRMELEGLIGTFSGISRIRTDLSGDPSFAEVLARANDWILGVFDNQDIPFMTVRRALLPDFPTDWLAVASALPNEFQYFRTTHDHSTPGTAVVERPGAAREDQELYFRGQLHPLSVTLLDDGVELWGEFSYKLDFYDEGTIDRLAADLERVLVAVGTDPSLRLSQLPMTPRPSPGALRPQAR